MAAPTKGSQLAAIHDKACKRFLDALDGEPIMVDGQPLRDEDGKILMQGPRAATLKEVREFLKDHGIDAELKEGTGIFKVAEAAKKYADDLDDPLLENRNLPTEMTQ